MADLQELARLHQELEWLRFEKRSDTAEWRRSWKQKDRWDDRWALNWDMFLRQQRSGVKIDRLVRSLDKKRGIIRKATPEQAAEIAAVTEALKFQVPLDDFISRGIAAYLGLALGVADDAGQFTLDALGLNETFAWASPRDFPGNLLAVRGSKIIASHYDNHLDRLARMVVEKCRPESPKTIGQLTREIQQEWDLISRKDALRVARTEAANVWETTNLNTMRLNGVKTVDWIIARGPSIGTTTLPVCKICLKKAVAGPYDINDLTEVPPAHPNCRCSLVLAQDEIWLPPKEPWTGGQSDFHTYDLDA